jgi:NADH-ubiquinone/plastoquinone oxidoreductase subunit 6
VELLLLARGKWPQGPRSVSAPLGTPAANVSRLGRSVFTTYLLAFEITSALLVIAVVGAVVLARRPRRLGEGAPEILVVDPEDDPTAATVEDDDVVAGEAAAAGDDETAGISTEGSRS